MARSKKEFVDGTKSTRYRDRKQKRRCNELFRRAEQTLGANFNMKRKADYFYE